LSNKTHYHLFFKALKISFFFKILEKSLGFFKNILIAILIGVTQDTDAYFLLLSIVSFLILSWVRIADVISVPYLSSITNKYLFSRVTGSLVVVSTSLSILLLLAIYYGGDYWTRLALGYDTEQKIIIIDGMRVLMPYILLIIPFHVLKASYRSRMKSFKVNVADLILMLTTIIMITFFYRNTSVLYYALSLGMLLAFVYIFYNAYKENMVNFDIDLRLLEPLLQNKQLLYLIAIQLLHVGYITVDRVILTFLNVGDITIAVFAYSIATLPMYMLGLEGYFIALYAKTDSKKDRRAILQNLVIIVIFISTVLTVLIFAYSQELITLIFERGEFSRSNSNATALVLTGYALSIFPMILTGVFDQMYQVEKKLISVIVRYATGVVANIFISIYLVFNMKLGVLGVAIGTTISFWIMLFLQVYMSKNITIFNNIKWFFYLLILTLVLISAFSLIELWFVIEALLIMVAMLIGSVLYKGEEGKVMKDTLKLIF
jgi:putative peptidoglycan lipid II flippase